MRALRLLVALAMIAVATSIASPAAADHSPPAVPTSPAAPATNALTKQPAGASWNFITNFPNLGTDYEWFVRDGKIYGVFGTFTQALGTHVGQRIIQLADRGVVNAQTVRFVGDHPSANCPISPSAAPFITGIQHDVQITPTTPQSAAELGTVVGQLIVDSNDAPGRCHDPGTANVAAKGGIEIIDITDPSRPKEVGLVRTVGENHNSTVDPDRPWIVYSSSADPTGHAPQTSGPNAQNYIDIINIRSCFGAPNAGEDRPAFIARLRAQCRPTVTRYPFQDEWTRGTGTTGTQIPSSLHTVSYACHDITYQRDRIYCAAINSTLILDVSQAFDSSGNLKGTPLRCDTLTPAAPAHPVAGQAGHPGAAVTSAPIVDCAARNSKADWMTLPEPRPAATGIQFVGVMRHAGRDASAGLPNSLVLQDISISHEADPTPDGKTLLVTDERGGGLLVPAASCAPGVPLPSSNGGLHFYDISDPQNPKPRVLKDGRTRAVFIAPPLIPAGTFCNIHIIDQVPDENRLFIAWYSQGLRVLDFSIDDDGRVSFEEIAYWLPPGADQWAAKPFLIQDNPDGGRTYYLAANNITRGIDVFSFTTPRLNRIPQLAAQASPPPARLASTGSGGSATPIAILLIAVGVVLLGYLTRRRASAY